MKMKDKIEKTKSTICELDKPLLFIKGVSLLYSFSLLPSLEWALLSPTEVAFPASFTTLVVMAFTISVA